MVKQALGVFFILIMAASSPAASQSILVGPGVKYSKEAQPTIDQLKSAVGIANISIHPAESGYSDGVVRITLDVTNLTDKTMAGIRVFGQSRDVFNKALNNFSSQTDQDIKPNETVTLETHRDFRETKKADQDKVKYYAQPIHIVFDDGSEIKDRRFQ